MSADVCAKLTPLGVAVLALLREGDMHPYEMIRILRKRRDDRLMSITNGTLYHTVSRLERAGLLEELGVDRDGNRPERTTYSLTASGHAIVADWVRSELLRIDRPTEVRVALAEAHNLERDEVIALLTERRAMLAAAHVEHRDGLASASADGIPDQFLVEVDRHTVLLDAELAWTDRLIERLASRDIAWGMDEVDPDHVRILQHMTREATHA